MSTINLQGVRDQRGLEEARANVKRLQDDLQIYRIAVEHADAETVRVVSLRIAELAGAAFALADQALVTMQTILDPESGQDKAS